MSDNNSSNTGAKPSTVISAPPQSASADACVMSCEKASVSATFAVPATTAKATAGTTETEAEEEYEDMEDTYTLEEIVKEQDRENEIAKELLGGQDDRVCSYPEGYKARQTVFACLTCAPSGGAGMCYGCSVHCHSTHDVVELYTKRRFCCDCGTGAFAGNKCTLYEDKSANTRNSYNHNYAGRFCACDRPYPDPEMENEEDMISCVVCEDWFHGSHIGISPTPEADCDLVCPTCVSKAPFLSAFAKGNETVETKCVSSLPPSTASTAAWLSHGWRERICKCAPCEGMFDAAGFDFLLDPEDPVDVYTEKNMAAAAECPADPADALIDTLVKTEGRDAAIHILQGFNSMKEQLASFLNAKASSSDNVVKAEDIHGFFDQLKRRRLEAKENENDKMHL